MQTLNVTQHGVPVIVKIENYGLLSISAPMQGTDFSLCLVTPAGKTAGLKGDLEIRNDIVISEVPGIYLANGQVVKLPNLPLEEFLETEEVTQLFLEAIWGVGVNGNGDIIFPGWEVVLDHWAAEGIEADKINQLRAIAEANK